MIVRDGFAVISGDTTQYEMPSGELDIVADDGRTLFSIKRVGNAIEISANGFCKHGQSIFNECITITPQSRNRIIISRKIHED